MVTNGETGPLHEGLRERIAEAYHRHQYGDSGTPYTLTEAEVIADAILDDLVVYPLGCLDPLGGFHMPHHDHEHVEGIPGCRIVVALSVYLNGGTGA